MVPLLVPLFISAFRRANDLAMAMEARCYHGGEHRTQMKPLHYEKMRLCGLWDPCGISCGGCCIPCGGTVAKSCRYSDMERSEALHFAQRNCNRIRQAFCRTVCLFLGIESTAGMSVSGGEYIFMKRVGLVVAYDGTKYSGWQTQPNGITIQGVFKRYLK